MGAKKSMANRLAGGLSALVLGLAGVVPEGEKGHLRGGRIIDQEDF